MNPLNLPELSNAEQAHSAKLHSFICEAIAAADGFLPFDQFMAQALYAPGLGYYMSGTRKFGAAGDFITAPEVSPIFSDCLATQVAEVLQQCGEGASVLEFGGGTGRMAADILLRLERLQCLPERYYILDLSAELASRQQQTLRQDAPHLCDRVEWLQTLDGLSLKGAVIGNEVLDAMPVKRFRDAQTQIEELGVTCVEGVLQPASRGGDEAFVESVDSIKTRYGADWPAGYESEWNANLAGWFDALNDCLEQGAIILIDYGYSGAHYYCDERSQGTLIGHIKHRVLDAPLLYPGLQDLSASVDFTAVTQAASAANFEPAGYTSQAQFLMATGLDRYFADYREAMPEKLLTLAQQVKQLTLPAEMGDRFQVIAFTKSLDCALCGFANRDFSDRL